MQLNTAVNPEQEESRATVNYAGFWIRLGAFMIDLAIMSIISIPIIVAIMGSSEWLAAGGYLIVGPYMMLGVFVLIGLVYFPSFWTWRGQTPGKMTLGIKIIRTNGNPISFGRAALRYLGYLVCYLSLYIGFVVIAFQKQKRGVHDLIADTCVITTR